MRRIIVTAVALLACACTSSRELRQIDDMTEVQYQAYLDRVQAQAGIVIGAAVTEGDLDPHSLGLIADAVRGLGEGSVAGIGQSLLSILDESGYTAAAIALAVIELDSKLAERGAYDEGGVLGERGRGVLLALAETLDSFSEQ